MLKIERPEPNRDLMGFFGGAETFDFYGMKPKAIPIKIFEYEMQQQLYALAREEASTDQHGAVAVALGVEPEKLRIVLTATRFALVSQSAHPSLEASLMWLQWLLANRNAETSLDELKVRLDYSAVKEFEERLSPAPTKAGAEGKATPPTGDASTTS